MAVAVSRLLPPSKPCSAGLVPLPFQGMATMKKGMPRLGRRKARVTKASSLSNNVIVDRGTAEERGSLTSLAATVAEAAFRIFKPKLKRREWPIQAELLVARGVINCRFFTLFAVAGALIGSTLCFVEGCFLVIESFIHYFRAMAQRSDGGDVVQLLIEALDLFLIGTAMLTFGMGMYILFVGSKDGKRDEGRMISGSNFFGLFHLKRYPSWMEMDSLSEAKSKIGHSLIMILHAGVLEKFKYVPMATGLDLACFAASVLITSACIFLLSKLSKH